VGVGDAAAVARRAGRLDEATEKRHRAILAAVGLPTGYRPGAWPRLREAMAVDKKSRARALRLVVLDALARPGILNDPPQELLERAYEEIAGAGEVGGR
jgi:3-dehydroquinate synthase